MKLNTDIVVLCIAAILVNLCFGSIDPKNGVDCGRGARKDWEYGAVPDQADLYPKLHRMVQYHLPGYGTYIHYCGTQVDVCPSCQ